LQGQGFENTGEETFVYYGAWDPRRWKEAPPRGGVGVAVLPRDRFGDLVVEEAGKGPGDYQLPEIVSEFVTTAIPVKKDTAHRFHVNADGLGPEATLRLELLTANETPLPAYSGGHAAIVARSGFQTAVIWRGKTSVTGLPDCLKVRVTFLGAKNTQARFSALHLAPE
jgi:hypothetical protein